MNRSPVVPPPARRPSLAPTVIRHAVRSLALGLAALAVSWGIASGSALVAAPLGAIAGVLIGQLLAGTRTRLPILLGGIAVVTGLGWWFGRLGVHWTWPAELLGPAATLEVMAIVRFGVLAFGITAGLRVIAARYRSGLGLELVATTAGLAAMFAGHRDGVIARPLWLSDWAWENGYDPVVVLLAIGGAAAVVLGGLLIAESRRSVSLISWVSLPLLALVAVALLDVQGLPEPEAGNDLGLTDDDRGDDPLPMDTPGDQGPGGQGGQGEDGGQSQNDGGQGGGQGQQPPKDPNGGGGGQGQQPPKDPNGGGGGQGQQPPKDPNGGGGQGQQPPKDPKGGGGGGSPPPKPPDVDDEQLPNEGPPAPMAVVLLGDDYSPPGPGYYFRQDAWSHYNGSRLVGSNRPDLDLDLPRSFPSSDLVVREPPPEQPRTMVHATVALVVDHKRPFALESVVSMGPEPNPNPKLFKRAYRFESLAQAIDYPSLVGRGVGHPNWSASTREAYLKGPSDPRYVELANTIIGELPPDKRNDPFLRALKIKLWMDENLVYSTAERHAGKDDPTADFLFGNRIGYCVHFAHAAVYLWRSLGIPARVGAGYMVTEDSRRGSALVIRGSDAHAWPELYLEGIGWVVLDITARQNLDPQSDAADPEVTELLAEMARKPPDEQAEPQPDEAPARGRGIGRPIGIAGALLLLLGLLALYGTKLWRRFAPDMVSPIHRPRVAYRRVVDQLAEIGIVRNYGETRESFARRLASRVPSLAHATALTAAASLGEASRPVAERVEFSATTWTQLLRSIDREVSTAAPAWRRFVGLVNPVSFLRAR